MTCNNLADVVPFATGFQHRIARPVVLYRDRRAFGGELVEGRPIWIENPNRNVPVTGRIRDRIGEHLVIGKQALLLVFIQNRLPMLAKIVPESISLSGLDAEISDTPDRTDVEIRALREYRDSTQQSNYEDYSRQHFPHVAS